MPFTKAGMDGFVANGLSGITEANARPVATDFPDYSNWLQNFVLNRIFHNHVSDERAALAFALLRRAEMAVEDWDAACGTLEKVARREKAVSSYFKTLRHMEFAVTATYQAFEFGRNALETKLFSKDDGSPLQRLNVIYNSTRHHNPNNLPAGRHHELELTNTGLSVQ